MSLFASLPLTRGRTDLSTAMFFPKDNPGYYALAEDAKKLIVNWTTGEWYESSTGDLKMIENDVESEEHMEL